MAELTSWAVAAAGAPGRLGTRPRFPMSASLRERAPRGRPGAGDPPRQGGDRAALPMVAPLLVFIGVLALYPTVLTAYAAFVHDDALDPPKHFTGSANFQSVFNNSQVRQSLANTGLLRRLRRCALGRARHVLRRAAAASLPRARRRARADGAAVGAARRGRGSHLVLDL